MENVHPKSLKSTPIDELVDVWRLDRARLMAPGEITDTLADTYEEPTATVRKSAIPLLALVESLCATVRRGLSDLTDDAPAAEALATAAAELYRRTLGTDAEFESAIDNAKFIGQAIATRGTLTAEEAGSVAAERRGRKDRAAGAPLPAWTGGRSLDELVAIGRGVEGRKVAFTLEMIDKLTKDVMLAAIDAKAAITDPLAPDAYRKAKAFNRVFPGTYGEEEAGEVQEVVEAARNSEAILSWGDEQAPECPNPFDNCGGAPVKRGQALCWTCLEEQEQENRAHASADAQLDERRVAYLNAHNTDPRDPFVLGDSVPTWGEVRREFEAVRADVIGVLDQIHDGLSEPATPKALERMARAVAVLESLHTGAQIGDLNERAVAVSSHLSDAVRAVGVDLDNG